MSIPLIEGALKRNLTELAEAAAPEEAVGIIWREQVYTLENRSETPESNFAVHLGDLRELIEQLRVPWNELAEDVIFWHSHPSGGVGPSRFDATHRTPLRHHLVVTLTAEGLVPTWY